MPRTKAPHPGRNTLAVAIVIAAAFVVSGLTARSHENSKQRSHTNVTNSATTPRLDASSGPTSPTDSDVVDRVAAATPDAVEPAGLRASDDDKPHEPAHGMIVGIDPETGKLGKPTPEQRATIDRAAALSSPSLDHSSEWLPETTRPDGTRIVDLQGRFADYAVVRITPDGRKEQVCVQGPAVEAALRGAATACDETHDHGSDAEAATSGERSVER